jgi:hypothetical protein
MTCLVLLNESASSHLFVRYYILLVVLGSARTCLCHGEPGSVLPVPLPRPGIGGKGCIHSYIILFKIFPLCTEYGVLYALHSRQGTTFLPLMPPCLCETGTCIANSTANAKDHQAPEMFLLFCFSAPGDTLAWLLFRVLFPGLKFDIFPV